MAHSKASSGKQAPSLRIRVVFGPDEMVGPGKAELLERIDRTGSIAAAGREMKMSYKRAWQLVESLNSMFCEPLVQSSRGGAAGGGAVLTAAGRKVLAEYRALEAEAHKACRSRLRRLQSMLGDIPRRK
jgi:molybdate transport system regulatory protein